MAGGFPSWSACCRASSHTLLHLQRPHMEDSKCYSRGLVIAIV